MKRELVDVELSVYEAFIATYPDLVRDVARMFEPPVESFNDFSGKDTWPESVVCCAKLETEWPDIGIIDPRPANKRPTFWWRANTKIRKDWLQKFHDRT